MMTDLPECVGQDRFQFLSGARRQEYDRRESARKNGKRGGEGRSTDSIPEARGWRNQSAS